MPITIGYSWRSHARVGLACVIAFAAGVVAATAGAGPWPRIVGGIWFLTGVYAVLDATILGASWRLTPGGMKIPTLASRQREISGGSELVVSPAGRWVGTILVTGERGTRSLRVNPLVSPVDLRAWFAAIADHEGAR